MGMKSVGYAQDATASTTQTLASLFGAAVPATSDFCIVQAESQSCRWRDDGVAPTATVGHLLAAGDTIQVRRGQYSRFQIIETTPSAKVNTTFYKTG